MTSETVFHKAFKLQGESFNSTEEIITFSKNISLEVYNFFIEWFNSSSFIEVNTSGSTGTPKLIQLQKAYMVNSAKATGDFFDLREGTKALLCMSANYIAGKMMLVRALELGWNLDIVNAVSNPLEGINNIYDFCAMVPLQLHNSLTEVYKVKQLIVGGGVVSKELLNKIQNIDTAVYATYGMTETVTHIAIKKLNNRAQSKLGSETYYNTLPNIKLSKDSRGCLVIDAPKISSERIVTNDLVDLISENQFKWLGRFDSIINSGGIKLIPEQIELNISEILSNRFFVTGIPDAVLGEKLVLIVEGEIKKDILKEIAFLKTLSKFENPKEVYFLPKFIETETQKINRKATISLL
ncbi:MAG: AMP-binding protein [Lutibacter sp.]|uniref:AMP-binding protein n=1 Tax=Lutibacter sp. TaxID=1925666 RepID=UPI0017F1FC17|nr:AMP-binding protein [Lutibacter sp.]MBT8316308.1 AMP-binding protein [Lutibacter sp.]NNJ57168.1 AMP-binding protein [Lutibacter sp.]